MQWPTHFRIVKSGLAALLIAAWAASTSSHAATYAPERAPPPPGAPVLEMPHDAVAVYLAAVDRGELRVFGRRLDRTMIEPELVEFVFDLVRKSAYVRIYSRVKVLLPVPEQTDFQIRGVSSIIGDEGNIIDTEAHVWTP